MDEATTIQTVAKTSEWVRVLGHMIMLQSSKTVADKLYLFN